MMNPRNLRFLAEIYIGNNSNHNFNFSSLRSQVIDLGSCTRILFPAGLLKIISSKSAIKAVGCMQVSVKMNVAWHVNEISHRKE